MSISLPYPRTIFVPKVPEKIEDLKVMRNYFTHLRGVVDEVHKRAFDNVAVIRDAFASATSGTFIASDGATVTVTNGIITALT